jgi:NAD(P)-dependent dehydrogenase (short-subunit alcohol dehydrogenase family)
VSDATWLGLEGRRVIVAGGAGTLGRAIVSGFVEANASVAVIDQPRALEQAAEQAAALPGAVVGEDLRSAPACRAAVAQACELLGGADVFVHAVGINLRLPIEDYTDRDWDEILTTNLSSAFWLTQALVPRFRAQRDGRLIYLSSVAGRSGHRNHGPYAATKAGIDQLMRVTAHELAGDGVTANAIAPGYMDTALTEAYLADHLDARERLLSLIPAGRFGVTGEVVSPTLFLASPRASFITGQVLYVDGGRTIV